MSGLKGLEFRLQVLGGLRSRLEGLGGLCLGFRVKGVCV